MTYPDKPQLYRDVIDALVDVCKHGQGTVGARRVREGVWNPNASAQHMPDQHKMNLLLARLSPDDRETLAKVLAQEVQLGVFEALKVIGEQFRVPPFESGYEGAAFHDFIGRMDDWPWPGK